MVELLRSVDFCIGRGFTQPTVIRTRARAALLPALSEVHAANYLLRRGFTIEGLNPRDGCVPEFVARSDEFSVAVEVYTPQEWIGLRETVDDLRDLLKHLDVAVDYRFEVRMEQLVSLDEGGHLISHHPGELAEALDVNARSAIIGALRQQLAQGLRVGTTEVHARWEDMRMNLAVVATLASISPSASRTPSRCGYISPIGPTGYAPETMFNRLLAGRVRKKAAKGQGPRSGAAPLSLLMVDLAQSGIRDELEHPSYRARFREAIEQQVRNWRGDYDMVAFCDSKTGTLRLHWWVSNGDAHYAANEIFARNSTVGHR